MRIAYYTPLALASAIGRASVPVAEALAAKGHSVHLVRSEFERRDEDLAHGTRLPVFWWNDIDPALLAVQYDIVLVNIGDHHGFHAGIFSALDHALCLGIFHDFYIYDLFRHWAVEQAGGDLSLHDAELRRIYGADEADLTSLVRPDMQVAEIAERFPMTEWLAERCAGALVHSHFYRQRLEDSCAGPVAQADLPYASRNVPPPKAGRGDSVTVLTIGHVNPNKCCAEVIEALSATEKPGKFAYRVAGPVSDLERERLEAIAAARGFTGLTLLGAVSDKELEQELASCDIICCLRKPVLEGASASAIEAMMAARPVIVADAGFYRYLPGGKVFKVAQDVPIDELAALLDRLRQDESLRLATGAEASDWALQTFAVEPYAATLEALAEQVIASSPLAASSVQMAKALSSLGLDPTDPAVDRIGSVMQKLFTRA